MLENEDLTEEFTDETKKKFIEIVSKIMLLFFDKKVEETERELPGQQNDDTYTYKNIEDDFGDDMYSEESVKLLFLNQFKTFSLHLSILIQIIIIIIIIMILLSSLYKSRTNMHCIDYHYGENRIYMHRCHNQDNQRWYWVGDPHNSTDGAQLFLKI